MSVIPLVRQNTIVETEAAFTQAGGDNGNAIWIKNLDPLQLNAAGSNVSYDLRVGSEYRDHREPGRKDLPAGSDIPLLPGAAVIIETEESVRLPRSMFGYIVQYSIAMPLRNRTSSTTRELSPRTMTTRNTFGISLQIPPRAITLIRDASSKPQVALGRL
jgi:hypothetical protein